MEEAKYRICAWIHFFGNGLFMALYLFQWGFILDSLADTERVEREMGLAFLIILLVQYLLSLSLFIGK